MQVTLNSFNALSSHISFLLDCFKFEVKNHGDTEYANRIWHSYEKAASKLSILKTRYYLRTGIEL